MSYRRYMDDDEDFRQVPVSTFPTYTYPGFLPPVAPPPPPSPYAPYCEWKEYWKQYWKFYNWWRSRYRYY